MTTINQIFNSYIYGPLVSVLDWTCQTSVGRLWLPIAIFLSTTETSVMEKFTTSWWCGVVALTLFTIFRIVVDYHQRDLLKNQKELEGQFQSLSKQNETLADENLKLKQCTPQLCYKFLRDLAKNHLKLDSYVPMQERVSLYVHDSTSQFQMIARFSMNPKLESAGRIWYPDDQGCISEGWKNRLHVKVMSPDQQKWVEECVRTYNIPRDVAESINMKSCIYGAIRISNDVGNHIGIVVVESTCRGRFTKKVLQTILNDTFGDSSKHPFRNHLVELIEITRPILGDLGTAKERGF